MYLWWWTTQRLVQRTGIPEEIRPTAELEIPAPGPGVAIEADPETPLEVSTPGPAVTIPTPSTVLIEVDNG